LVAAQDRASPATAEAYAPAAAASTKTTGTTTSTVTCAAPNGLGSRAGPFVRHNLWGRLLQALAVAVE